jgi:transketolase
MALQLAPRRGVYIDIAREIGDGGPLGAQSPLSAHEVACYEELDLVYRSLCTMLYNYVPMSGHPGGSISSGRFVAGILFDVLDYDFSDPDRADADLISYAAGHKAMGLYAMWALRNEIVRIAAPYRLPEDERLQLRLEDLLGFRRNPVARTPLFTQLRAKALDGHPTPATPFVKLATGASGVGVASSLGLALGASDFYGEGAPRVHIVEGEGGLTPGRVSEALAAAGTASLSNALLHVDWNQASIDSNRVCREDRKPGDYVQWNPAELAYLHDWNVILVEQGMSFQQILAAQRRALALETGQPTAIVYRTVKGWRYGIEGKASHGAGHKLCSTEFHEALQPLVESRQATLPTCCDPNHKRCEGEGGATVMELCFWDALQVIRDELAARRPMVDYFADRLEQARTRLTRHARAPRAQAPHVDAVYAMARTEGSSIPADLALKPGASTTLRQELGRAIARLNRESGGAFLIASADLLGSTSVNVGAEGFPQGYWNAAGNPGGRLLSVGGICEDAMAGLLAGLSSYGHHIGLASSYAAFLAPLAHIAARLHGIGSQARLAISPQPFRPLILACAHAGLKTGEDGPTHADPQPLQLLQENFPPGVCITLTPWDPQELWPLLCAALVKRPAVIALFVTRPNEPVLDREQLGLAPPPAAAQGLYRLRAVRGRADGTVVLQGSEVAYAFVQRALPLLLADGVDLDVYYVASAELFDALPAREQERIYSPQRACAAMGITGFTLPTMLRWVTGERGRAATLHPFQKGHFLGSGQAQMVLEEAGLDGRSQYRAILRFVEQPVRS